MAAEYIPKGTTDLSAYFTNGDSVYMMEGEQTITAGTDHSGVAGVVDFIIGPACGTNCTANALKVAITGVFHFSGQGSWKYDPNGTGTDSCAVLIHDGTGTLSISGSGTTPTITEWQQSNGTGWAYDTILVTNIRLTGGVLNQLYSATRNTNWDISGAVFNTGRGLTGTANITGGAYVTVRREDTSATLPTASGATINIGNATLKWNGANIGTLKFLDPRGRLDFSDAPIAFSIASITGDAKAIQGSGLPTVTGQTAKNKANISVTATAVTLVGSPTA